MRINLNVTKNNNYYRPNFQMRLVEDASVLKYINSFHSKNKQNNLKQAVNIIKGYITNNMDNKSVRLAVLHPSKANYVKSGTYDEYFTRGKTNTKKISDRYERENVYMQLEGSDKIQGFYMNPDENPQTLAGWFMDTFNFYKNRL